MNAAAETAPTLQAIPLEQISLGKNYRKRRPANWEAKLDELAASMKQNGQLEPVLVRPIETPAKEQGDYEIVFGERRYRAAKKAGLETLLAIVRDVPDDQVLELQLSENGDREDAHPLDEAEAFQALVKRGRSPTEIAATRGCDVSYVVRRLALCNLSEKVRKAFDKDEITFSVALLIAALPDHKTQDDALDECSFRGDDSHITVAGAREAIERRVLVRLSEAPFKRDDAGLVPAAGPCTTCPKRTGAQGALFETKTKDLCTDTGCFRAKVDADWAARSKAHKADGGEVMAVGTAKVVLGRGGYTAKDNDIRRRYAKLDDEVLVGSRYKSARALFGKELPPIILGRHPDTGVTVELVLSKDVDKAKGAASPAAKRPAPATTAANRRERLKDLARTEATRRSTAAIVSRIEQVKAWEQLGTKLLLPLACCVIEATWHDGRSGLIKRRGWDKVDAGEQPAKPKKKGNTARGVIRERDMTATLLARLAELRPSELAGVIVELIISRGAPAKYSGEPGDEWSGIANALGVDYETILEGVVEAQAENEKAKTAKAPAPKPKARVAKKKAKAR